MTSDDPRFPYPFGVPKNRKPEPGLIPVEGRPGWWRDPKTGVEKYIEPPRPEAGQAPAISYEEGDHIWPYVGDEE